MQQDRGDARGVSDAALDPSKRRVAPSREQQVARALLSITDHLVSGDDAVDLLSELAATAVRLLEVDACGVLLADELGQLHVVAASCDAARTLELLALQRDEGPCLDCYRTMQPVNIADVSAESARWPTFAAAAEASGFVAVGAVPMRLRTRVLGALGLFSTRPGALSDEDVELAEALGHMAGITLVAQRAAADQQQLTEQLKHALESRVVIEQSKGLIAAKNGLKMDSAFRALRKYARDHNSGLTAVARSVVSGQVPAQELLDHVNVSRRGASRP